MAGDVKEGRPMIFKTAQELQEAVDDYFMPMGKIESSSKGGTEWIDSGRREENLQPTLAGLALSLGISRSSLYNYEDNNEFLDIIKKARERVEATYEARLIYSQMPTGVIFALKNMGWKDKTETALTGENGGPVQITGMKII